nr:MAG: hypothetical protein [Microvirus sp.]
MIPTVLGDTRGLSMARTRSRNTTYSDPASTLRQTRVAAVNATTTVVRPVVYRPLIRPLVSYLPLAGEDRRTFHPDGPFRAPFSSPRVAAKLVVKNASGRTRSAVRGFGQNPPIGVGFYRPDRVAICVRRKTRRQVIFASGVGGSKVRRGKRNFASGFRCS